MAEIFRRIEKKYILNKEQYNRLIPELKKYMNEDIHGESTIRNIYFDTDQYELIRHSITKPYYKEKVRLRSYNKPNKESKVYLEIKRKCDNVVGKRRIEMKLEEFEKYVEDPNSITTSNMQIKKELDYTFKLYNLKPAMYVSYLRTAYYQKDNMDFRATFDSHIVARKENLRLDSDNCGEELLKKDHYILEIKTLGIIPMWFVNLINELKIRPGNFSKYGEAYEQIIMEKEVANKQEEPVKHYVLDKVRLVRQPTGILYQV